MPKVRVVLLVLAGILALSYCSQARAQAKLLGDDTGWAIRVGLQWTDNDGKDWQQITPKAVLDGGWSMVNAFFLNTSNGWALLQKGRQTLCCQFALASTDNHGLSWSVKPMNLPIWWSPNQEVFSGGGAIDFVDPMHGWVNLGMESASGAGFLFSTDDGGETWQRVKSGPGIAGEVRFITLEEGWVHGGTAGRQLYGTHDGGKTWKEVNLPPPVGLAPTSAKDYYLPKFQDPSHGYLPVGFAYMGTNSAAVVLFQTADGGRTWKPTKCVVSLPFAYEVPLAVADSTLFVVEQTAPYKTALVKATPDGRVEKLPGPWATIGSGITFSFSNSAHGWAHGAGGDILVTTDGGQTWTNPAPVHHGKGHRMQPSEPAQSPQSSLSLSGGTTQTSALAVTTTAAPNGGSANWHTAEHLGFDSCDYLTPSGLQTWWQYSPYYDEGIYLPGAIDAGCPLSPNAPLTATQWVTDAVNQGWGIVPIWFGLQPYCTLNKAVKKTWPSTETLQDLQSKGASEANGKVGAEAEASQLGLSGSVIYFDMENWDTNDATCNQQVASFINGWVTQLHQDGWKAGVYTNAMPAEVLWNSSLLTIKPDDIWVARYDEHATIWGVGHDLSGGLADDTWSEGFRAHQYLNSAPAPDGNGTGAETYGGVTVNPIDRDIEYAQVAGGSGWKSYTYTVDPLLVLPGAQSSGPSGISDAYQGFIDSVTGIGYSGQMAGSWFDGTNNYGYAYDPYNGQQTLVSMAPGGTHLKAISNVGFTNPASESLSESFGQASGWSGTGSTCPCGPVTDSFLDPFNGSFISADYNGSGTPASFSLGMGINDNCQNSGGCQAVGQYAAQIIQRGNTYCYQHGYVRPRGGAAPDTPVDFKGATDTLLRGINGFG